MEEGETAPASQEETADTTLQVSRDYCHPFVAVTAVGCICGKF